jgi:hypothetical protein
MIGFAIKDFNQSLPLVIDPALKYSIYLGGSGRDISSGIAIDGSGNAYVTGSTDSTNFPITNYYSGYIYQPRNAGSNDAFVTKLTSSGKIWYSTYLGGSDNDFGLDIAIDYRGNAYVTGSTYSRNFPTENAYQARYSGGADAFVTELSSTGDRLIYSTYLGGSHSDGGNSIAVDSSGSAYVTGCTYSSDFPKKESNFNSDFPFYIPHAYQLRNAGGYDAFVTKLSPAGTRLIYSTYLGGSSDECANGIAVDSSGNAYVTGRTYSEDFPPENACQTVKRGRSDAFVTKLSGSGRTLVYSTYLGGSDEDWSKSIAVDSSGSAYVTGETYSEDFPPENACQTAKAGDRDAFVTKLSGSGRTLVYSTYLGGSDEDWSNSIALDSSGNAYVTGYTYSGDFPRVNAYQAEKGGQAAKAAIYGDAFVTKLSSTGDRLIYSTYLGGIDLDGGNSIAIDGSGSAYVTGYTYSSDFPNANQAYFKGSVDTFIAALRPFKLIALRACNGQYVCAEGGGGGEVVANRNAIGDWETFGLIDLRNNNVALQAANGQYVCAEGGGGGEVVANRDAIGDWETFRLIDLGNNNVALQAANGQYVCAEGGGGRAIVANSDAIGDWETFSPVPV